MTSRLAVVLLLNGLLAAPAGALELLATSYFPPDATEPTPTLDGVFRIDLDTGIAAPFIGIGTAGLAYPTDVAVDPSSGNIFVSTHVGSVLWFGPGGTPLTSPIPGGDAGLFAAPGGGVTSLAFDASGNLLAADTTGVISTWDPATGARGTDVVSGISEINKILASPDGAVLAQSGPAGYGPGTVWRIESGVATEIISSTTTSLVDGGAMFFTPLGDADADADADVADVLAWQRGEAGADFDASGTVDAVDLGIWQDSFGGDSRLLVADFAGNKIVGFDADGTGEAVFTYLPPVTFLPYSNFPSEMLLSDRGTLLVSTMGPTRRPDNDAMVLEYDLDGNLLGTLIDNLPPVSGIAIAPPIPAVAVVPEPAGLLLAVASLLAGMRRR